ncbi:hypothetical protein [Streptomyces sp. RKAG290]|uniref:hypothetical protein n=1 Tax=Streptomyces sp. RKAG290 TaxID=2888348 RepID=UPI0020345A1B|nr:hypothetical protein [Streptomyces sp. RKAG290]MCM2416166.1 hypothetical protein [Streptomyces sp. RKAG290]
MRASTALAVYDHHGDALFSLALLLCRDVDRAVEAVVATVTQACATASDPMPDTKRQSLAADLWRRYAADPCAQPSQPDPALRSEPYSDGPSGDQDQALLGLVLFGCHTYGQAAALVGVSAPSTAVHLRSVLRRAAGDVPADRRV